MAMVQPIGSGRAALHGWLKSCAPRLERCGFHAASPGHRVDGINRRMELFDLWHVASGTGAVRTNGQWHEFGADDLVALFPGDVYEAECAGTTAPFQVTFAYLGLSPAGDEELARALRPHWPVVIGLRRQPAVRNWFRQLFEWTINRERAGFRYGAITGTCWLILDAVWRELESPPPGQPSAVGERLELTRAFIKKNLAEPIQLADLAAAAALSVSALEVNFRRAYGISPVAYLLRCRLETAQLLLARGIKPKQVCAETGFHSLQYFSRFFRAHTGLSPRAFAEASARLPGRPV